MAQLKYDITPRNAPKFAADAVAAIQNNEGITRNYSIESLEIMDAILGQFHADGVKVEQLEATLFSFGCYVGEVFVRNAGASWRKASQREKDQVFGVPLVLQLGESTINPIGKVLKHLENGDEDNLPCFYRVFSRPKAG